jgi:hypothetical protein
MVNRVRPSHSTRLRRGGQMGHLLIAQDPDREGFDFRWGLSQARTWMSCAEWLSKPDYGPAGIRVGAPLGGSVIPSLNVAMPDAEEWVKSGNVDVFGNKAEIFRTANEGC